MNFFRYYPTTPYQYQVNGDTFTLSVVNTTAHVKLVSKVKENLSILYDYVVRDGERPDSVAQAVYGTVAATWVVLMVNGIFSLHDWVKTSDEQDAYLTERYGSLAAAQSQWLYQTVEGYRVDLDTYTALPGDQRGEPFTVYDDELNRNEAKRRIKLIPTQFVAPMLIELSKVLR